MQPHKIFVGIPVLNRIDLLEKAVASIDVPAQIVVINNNTVDQPINDSLERLKETTGVRIENPRYNLGVSASWNRLLLLAQSWGYDYAYIGSNDTTINPGALEKLRQVDMTSEAAIWHIVGWNMWAINLKVIGKVGLFDENFYPAYREDQDYSYRCLLAGVPRYIVGDHPMPGLDHIVIPGVNGIHLGSQTIAADSEYASKNKDTHGNWNTAHYRMKWGGMPTGETFKTPYNDASHDHRWWPDPGDSIAHRDWDKERTRVRG